MDEVCVVVVGVVQGVVVVVDAIGTWLLVHGGGAGLLAPGSAHPTSALSANSRGGEVPDVELRARSRCQLLAIRVEGERYDRVRQGCLIDSRLSPCVPYPKLASQAARRHDVRLVGVELDRPWRPRVANQRRYDLGLHHVHELDCVIAVRRGERRAVGREGERDRRFGGLRQVRPHPAVLRRVRQPGRRVLLADHVVVRHGATLVEAPIH
mmetsp:Transcript_93806/g.268542  ORF Transcript_93806/g.268542 Transcript_93806/m.268542 type:complete len:210 (-) Transcript_93806:776-1405(-)